MSSQDPQQSSAAPQPRAVEGGSIQGGAAQGGAAQGGAGQPPPLAQPVPLAGHPLPAAQPSQAGPAQPIPTNPAQPIPTNPAQPIPASQAQPIPANQQQPAARGQVRQAGGGGGALKASRPVPLPAAASLSDASRPIPVQQGAAMPRTEEEEPNRFKEYLKTAPAWLFSAVTHMILLIVLAVWWIYSPEDTTITLSLSDYADELGDQLADDLLDFKSESATDEDVLTPQFLDTVSNPFQAPPQPSIAALGMASSTLEAIQIGPALIGRSEGRKEALLKAFGGSVKTEAAVQRGLEWLVRQQRPDGSWSLSGPYNDGISQSNPCAATAMALLAFQGNGHTHIKKGKYKKLVEKAMKWLVEQQAKDGSFPCPVSHHFFYTQGQCTIALCELYGMTQDSWLRGPAEKAVKYCVDSQHREGGWKYQSPPGSDTSVTGWILMGLQSARMARLDVPQKTLDNVSKYLDSAASNDDMSRYGYFGGAEARPSMTAEALLCRQYLGWKQDNEALVAGVEYLLGGRNLPSTDDENVYYWYYATQVMHHIEGDYWKKWNGVMPGILTKSQETVGRERGSWDPRQDRWGGLGGRLYQTCLSVYILEVYYRHLPIYRSNKGLFNSP